MVNDRREPHQGTPSRDRSKSRLNTKIHLAVDANGMPVRISVTKGTLKMSLVLDTVSRLDWTVSAAEMDMVVV